MKDRGIVISTHSDLADVKVECLVEACSTCSARSICANLGPSKGCLTVKNPLRASVGDEVEIEIPEHRYNRALILIFCSLVLASLSGIGIGSLFSLLFSLSPQTPVIIGFFLALVSTGAWLFRHFRKKNREFLYPVIINIIHKGDSYG